MDISKAPSTQTNKTNNSASQTLVKTSTLQELRDQSVKIIEPSIKTTKNKSILLKSNEKSKKVIIHPKTQTQRKFKPCNCEKR